MKYSKLIFITFLLLSTQLLFGQIIPKEIKVSFETIYPEASEEDWFILTDEDGFQVDFIDEEKNKCVILIRG